MPNIVAISDTHNLHEELSVPNGDIVVHAGDFTNRGKAIEVICFLEWYQALPHKHKVLIAGNHDWMCQKDPEYFASLLKKYAPSVTYLNESSVVIEGLKFFGSPWTPEFFDWAFNAVRGEDIKSHWNKIPLDTQVLVTHGPGFGILDDNYSGKHVGCANLRDIIDYKLNAIKLHIFGHVHSPGGGIISVGDRVYLNASVVNENYIITNQPNIIELNA